MKCPFCRSDDTEVYNSRETKAGSQIWRRRRCQLCHEAFTTYEAADLGFLKVLKRSGKTQPYARAKLYLSIYGACSSLKAPQATVDAITDTVEAKLLDLRQTPLPSQQIASVVLTTLKHFHTTAFVRYLAHQTDLTSDAQLKRELKKY